MHIYIINLMFAYITIKLCEQYTKEKAMKIGIFFSTLSLVCISGLRFNVGTDFMTYYYFFSRLPDINLNIVFSNQYNLLTSFEKGFFILTWIISRINSNPQFIIFVISAITIVPIMITIKKYSVSTSLSVFLYITTMNYYSAYNGIRQWIAAAILFMGIKYVYEKNMVKYFILILIASTIHTSVMIFIPIYFIINLKAWSKKNLLLCIATIAGTIYLPEILGFFAMRIEGEYQKYFIISSKDQGINYMRIVVALVPVIVSAFYYKKLKNIDEKIDILINLSMINVIFKILATQKNIINRFSLYFDIYNIFLIPIFVYIFKKEERRFLRIIIMILYFLYMLMLLPSQSNLLPYKFFFNS